MPCDTRPLRRTETLAERMAADKARLAKLEDELLKGRIRLIVNAAGAIAFAGWEGADRDGISDVCAFRTLRASSSWALRQAVAKAEASGTKVDARIVAAGTHSHDGGKTWHPGH